MTPWRDVSSRPRLILAWVVLALSVAVGGALAVRDWRAGRFDGASVTDGGGR
jgi:hypothetical protein